MMDWCAAHRGACAPGLPAEAFAGLRV